MHEEDRVFGSYSDKEASLKDVAPSTIAPYLIDDSDQDHLSSIAKWKKRIFKSRVLNNKELRVMYSNIRCRKKPLEEIVDPINRFEMNTCVACDHIVKKFRTIRPGVFKIEEYLDDLVEDWDQGYLRFSEFSYKRKRVLLEKLDQDRVYLKYLLEDEAARILYLRKSKEDDHKALVNYSQLWMEALMSHFSANSKKIRSWIVLAMNYLEQECVNSDKLNFWQSLKNLTLSRRINSAKHYQLHQETEKEIQLYVKCLRYLRVCERNKKFRKVLVRGKALIRKLKRKKMREFLRLKLNLMCDLKDAVGNANLHLKNYNEAMDYFAEELTLAEKKHIPNAIFRALDNIGLLFATKGEYENAIFVWTIRLPSLDSDVEHAWINHSIAQCYAHLNTHRKSLEFAKTAAYYGKRSRNLSWEICSYILMAHNYCLIEKNTKEGAMKSLCSALDCLYDAFVCATCIGNHKIREVVSGLFGQAMDKLEEYNMKYTMWKDRCEDYALMMLDHLEKLLAEGGHYLIRNSSNETMNGLVNLLTGKDRRHEVHQVPLMSPSSSIKERTRQCIMPLLKPTFKEGEVSHVNEGQDGFLQSRIRKEQRQRNASAKVELVQETNTNQSNSFSKRGTHRLSWKQHLAIANGVHIQAKRHYRSRRRRKCRLPKMVDSGSKILFDNKPIGPKVTLPTVEPIEVPSTSRLSYKNEKFIKPTRQSQLPERASKPSFVRKEHLKHRPLPLKINVFIPTEGSTRENNEKISVSSKHEENLRIRNKLYSTKTKKSQPGCRHHQREQNSTAFGSHEKPSSTKRFTGSRLEGLRIPESSTNISNELVEQLLTETLQKIKIERKQDFHTTFNTNNENLNSIFKDIKQRLTKVPGLDPANYVSHQPTLTPNIKKKSKNDKAISNKKRTAEMVLAYSKNGSDEYHSESSSVTSFPAIVKSDSDYPPFSSEFSDFSQKSNCSTSLSVARSNDDSFSETSADIGQSQEIASEVLKTLKRNPYIH